MNHLRAGVLAALLLLLALAAPAQAGISAWTNFPGLNHDSGSSWVREYASSGTTLYAATEGNGVYRSTNNGVDWSPFSGGLGGSALNVRTVFVSGGTVFAGTEAGLFKSTGGGWTPVVQGPEDNPAQPKKLNRSVQTVLTGNTGQLLAGTFAGGVYKSTDDGATWTPPAPGNGMPSGETVWSLTTLAPNVILAGTSSGVYRSTDFGSTWSPANDGISGVTLRVFADGTNPNIFYAATPGNGIFRTVNLGATWSQVNGTGPGSLGDTTVRALQQFNGPDLTRLYAGTANGLWAGETANGPGGGKVRWRKVTNSGLISPGSANTIFWALTSFVTTPGTLIAGTQSNGGYALTLQPPVNTIDPSVTSPNGLTVGKTVVASPGTWTGTPTIEYEYQWQRCTSSDSGCSDITDATTQSYVLDQDDLQKYVRVVVTAKNDFPTFNLATDKSTGVGKIGANPDTLPGGNQKSAASISGPALPQSGNTLFATGWLFNPAATSTSFVWYRCDSNGTGCDPVPGATGQTYTLTDDDVGSRFRVVVYGTNGSGTDSVPISNATNEVFPEQATQLSPATMTGVPYPGETLVSGVGIWKFPGTSWTRQWELCNADGGSCATISGEKGPSYTVRAGDLGHRLRVRIGADSNGPNKFPGPVEVFSPLSDTIVERPAVGGSGGDGGGGGLGGGGGGPGDQDLIAPVASGLKFSGKGKVKRGGKLKLSYNLSEPATLSLRIDKLTQGRKKGKKCVRKGGKGKKCTLAKKVGTITLRNLSGKGAVAVPAKIGKKKLSPGSYRAVITPVDAAGNKGKPKTLGFKVTRR